MHWTLLLNLAGALFLLLELRRRWYPHTRKQDRDRLRRVGTVLAFLAVCVVVNVGLPLLGGKLGIHPGILFWGAIAVLWAVGRLYEYIVPRLRRSWHRADYLRYHGGPLDGRPLMWPGRDEPMWCGVVDSAHCLLPRIDTNGGYYELNREKARYEWQQDYGPPLIEAHLPPEHRAQHAQAQADPQ